MKRAGHLIEQVADMDNLMLAFFHAQRGKACKQEVLKFRESLQKELLRLQSDLLSGTVMVGNYHTFTIHDPKERQICAAAFDERVLHHALMHICHPAFDRNLISDTYATRIGKGTYAALDRAHRASARYRYVAKLDVRKYFDSIDHTVLKLQLRRLFKDNLLLAAFEAVVDTYHTVPGKGLPIGNLTSQYFANHYLSGLDHYVKERLRVPVYVRYMDDMLLFGDDRKQLVEWVSEMEHYCADTLLLSLKSPQIVSTGQGVSFLGYRLQKYRIGLNSRSRNRFARKLALYTSLLETGKWSQEDYRRHVSPLFAFVEHAYTKKYRMKNVTARRLEPCESWRKLEQQRKELPCVESQQQQRIEPQQQLGLPSGSCPVAYVKTYGGCHLT